MSTRRLRPEIQDFKPYVPGLSIDEIKARYGLTRVVKLASNENPLGTSPLARKAAERAAALGFRYPQNHNPALVAAIAARLGAPVENVVAGHGSDEMIDLLLRVVGRDGDHVLCWSHAFSMYRLTAKLCGLECREAPRDPDAPLPLEALARAADERTAVVFVTSPDNPTGRAARLDELRALADRLPEGTILAVDEAYVDFARPLEEHSALPLALERDNVIALRTFSKAYGLAGFRLGFGVMPPWLAQAMTRARIPFTIGVLDEAAGIAGLTDDAFLAATLETVHAGIDRLTAGLTELGCVVGPSQANFLMFTPPRPGQEVFQGLLERGVIVRPLASFGLPERIRVSVGTEEENEIFLRELAGVLHG